jgi:hypothetical protein
VEAMSTIKLDIPSDGSNQVKIKIKDFQGENNSQLFLTIRLTLEEFSKVLLGEEIACEAETGIKYKDKILSINQMNANKWTAKQMYGVLE